MKLDKEKLVFYKDKNGNTEFRLANITAFFAEGFKLYSGETIPPFCLYIPVCLRLKGKVDEERMKFALDELVRRNHAFGMNLVKEKNRDGYRFRIIENLDYKTELEIPESDDPEVNMEYAQNSVKEIIYKYPDLENETLFTIKFIKLGNEDYFLGILLNHVITDGHSVGNLMNQLLMTYLGKKDERLYAGAEFMDFYLAQAESRTEETEKKYIEYWKNEFADLPRIKTEGRTGSHDFKESDFYLSFEKEPVQEFCRQNSVTFSSVILAAVHYAQTAVFGERDTAITYSMANRNKLSHFTTAGPIVQMISHRLKIGENDTYIDILKKTGKKVAENIKNQNTWNENIGGSRFMLTFMNQGGVEMVSSQGDGVDEISFIPGIRTSMWQVPMIVNWDLYFFVMFITETGGMIEIGFATNPKYVPVEDLNAFKSAIVTCIENMKNGISDTVSFKDGQK